MRSATLVLAAALLCSSWTSPPAAPAQERVAGTWTVQPNRMEGADRVQLTLVHDDGGVMGMPVEVRRLEGLSADAMAGAGGPVRFRLAGEAGAVSFTGRFRDGRGSGEFSFAGSPRFADALAGRGLERPTQRELLSFTLRGVQVAAVDALLREFRAQDYPTPTVRDLVRVVNRDMTVGYVRDLGAAGYRGLAYSELIRLHNRGIDAALVRELRSAGYEGLSPAQLVRLHNHGVTPEVIRRLNRGERERLTPEELIRLRRRGSL